MSNPRTPQVAAIVTALALLATASSAQSPAGTRRGNAAARSIAAQPLTFEEHRAPGATRRTFVSRGAGYTLSLTPAAAELTLPRSDLALRMTLQGANLSASMQGLDPQGRMYRVTEASRGELTGAPTFARVRYSGVYHGIDLVYYGSDRQLEFDFLLAAGADPKKIRFSIDGADALSITPDGELSLRIRDHEFRLRTPVIYQTRDGKRDDFRGGYRIVDARRRIVGFDIGRYDRSRPLVIDPTIVFATYLGSADGDSPKRVEADGIGSVYLLADTRDPSTLPANLPVHVEPLAPAPNAGSDQCLLTKLNADGASAQYSILFQGTQCQAMALDRSGGSGATRIHVAIGTSYHYLRTISESPNGGLTIQGINGGSYDACQIGSCGPTEWLGADDSGNVYFVMHTDAYELHKLDATGQPLGSIVLLQPPVHTGPGSGSFIYDQMRAFDVDENGVFYGVAVLTEAGLITPTADALQPNRPSAACTDPSLSACWDGAIMVVDTNEPGPFQFRYVSYFGGSDYDYVAAIAHDPAQPGVVYITGATASANFPTTPGTYFTQPPFNGGAGYSFVAKLNLAPGTPPIAQRMFSTFIGPGYSYTQAVRVLPGSGVAVIGNASDDPCPPFQCFPQVSALHPKRSQQEQRPFLAVLSANGTSVPFASYLDATLNSDSFAYDLATNGSQLVYVAMTTTDPVLATPGALQTSPNGQRDALVTAIDISTLLPANHPPEISFTPAVLHETVIHPNSGALVPIVCGKLFDCAIADPDGDQIEQLEWFGPNSFHVAASALPAAASADIIPKAYLALPAGTHTVTLRARDTEGRIGSAALTVQVGDQNTFPGGNQTVPLRDEKFVVFGAVAQGSEQPVTVTFDNVTAPGLTYLDSVPGLVPAPPAGLQAGSPPYVYDIQSTAAFDPGLEVCFNTRGMSFARPNGDVQIYQLVNGGWTPIASQSQPDGFHICGRSNTLGKFVLLYPEVPSTAITVFAGTGCAENSRDGAGGDPCDDFAAIALATQSSLTRPGQIAVDRSGGAIYVADNGGSPDSGIRHIDLATRQISTAVPAGICYGFGPLALDPVTGEIVCTQWNTATGLRDIVSYDQNTGAVTSRLTGWNGEIRALAFDASDNLFFTDSLIYRIVGGGAPPQRLVATRFIGGAGVPHIVPYYESFWTLAFDREGCMLAGGVTLVRVCPGADGIVDGSADESLTRVAGVTSVDWLTYAQPFGGDGFPAIDALTSFTYQMTVAADGAVVFTDQTGRIRRIDPGADGVVTGEADEIVRTIAGYLAYSIPDPTPFATSEYGDFRGLVEDPRAAGHFFVSSHSLNKMQRFGMPDLNANPAQADLAVVISAPANQSHVGVNMPVTFTVVTENHGPSPVSGAQLSVPFPPGFEFVSAGVSGGSCVNDSAHAACTLPSLAAGASVTTTIVLRPTATGTTALSFTAADAATPDPNGVNNTATVQLTVDASPIVINVDELITVHDATALLPAAMVVLNEQITVTDTNVLLPAAMVALDETIHVADVWQVLPAVQLNLVEQIHVTDVTALQSQVFSLALQPPSATSPNGTTHVLTALVADESPEDARVLLGSFAGAHARVAFVNPGGANQPLSITVQPNALGGNDLIVSLATNAAGALSTSAAQVVAVIQSDRAPSFLEAALWPGSAGGGIVQPRPLTPLVPVRFSFSGIDPMQASCETTVPGRCTFAYTRTKSGAETIDSYVDLNGNGISDGEPTASATKIWENRLPVANAGLGQAVEATSSAGAAVTVVGRGEDLDDADPLTYAWSEGGVQLAASATATLTLGVGEHDLTFTVTDSHGGAAFSTVHVSVLDTRAPVVGVPSNITVNATEIGGARVSFIAVATDVVDGLLPVTCTPGSGSLFPVGTTAVNCEAVDAHNNRASATFFVTINPGTPRLSARVLSTTRLGNDDTSVVLQFTNLGDGVAVLGAIDQVSLRILAGTGTLSTTYSSPAPLRDLAPGQSLTVTLVVHATAGITRYSVTENGHYYDARFTRYTFSMAQPFTQ